MSGVVRPSRSRQCGLSLVELMVGIAIGLLVVAGASLLVSTQLGENRRLLLETQVQQDLRASADMIARELRRAGQWGFAERAVRNPSLESLDSDQRRNIYSPVATAGCGAGPWSVCFKYQRVESIDGSDPRPISVPSGYRLLGGVISTRLSGSSGWQELTDVNVLFVESFNINLSTDPGRENPPSSVTLPCPKLCPGGDTACWPKIRVRDVIITITARAVSDERVRRRVESRVRLRNDQLFTDAGPLTQSCPA